MNSIFRKTLIATILSATLGTVAIAADNNQDTMDGKLDNQGQESDGRENRPLSDLQANVIKGKEKATDKSGNHRQEIYSPEDRPLSDLQGDVIEGKE